MEFARRRRTFFAVVIPLLIWAFSRPQWSGFLGGLVFVVLGQALRIWASGHIHKAQEVATGGPYAFNRNPLYVGSLLIAVGFALMSGVWWAWPVTFLQFAFFYYLAILSEERFLSSRLGRPYAEYCARVPRVLVRLSPYEKAEGRFEWSQVLRNEEYRSVLPVTLLCCMFAARILLRA